MVHVVQQYWSEHHYNVWENVDLKQTTENNDGLMGEYLVHKLNTQDKRNFKQGCNWAYDGLYIIKDIYGGFLEFLKDEVI